jgi:hypothetical protein
MSAATSAFPSTNAGSFLIHYDPSVITAGQAQQLDADAEAGRSLEIERFGFPAPVSDTGVTPASVNPDGRTDVFVHADSPCPPLFSATCACNGFTTPDPSSGATTSGWISINPAVVGNKSTIAHEFFHTVQLGIARDALNSAGPDPLTEASASYRGHGGQRREGLGAEGEAGQAHAARPLLPLATSSSRRTGRR